MKLEDLIQNYGCISCDATKHAVDKYNKVDERLETAIKDAWKNLEVDVNN